MGYIYILTNPSIPNYVKIGYTARDDVQDRVKELNRTECTPLAFRIYATYQVDCKQPADVFFHCIIDELDSTLRSKDIIENKERVREFFAMTAEKAFSILEAIAKMHDREDKLIKNEVTPKELDEDEQVKQVARKRMNENFRFSLCNIKIGEQIEFSLLKDNPNFCKSFTVVDDKHVDYNGEPLTLSKLARELGGRYEWGADNFTYRGEFLNSIRAKLGNLV